ncbi:hypothetical protein GCM10010251_15660 [Streptomyces aurantiogriseus]|uniref:Uncharacterized protein n=1 Tax=Streptomyces aurantiogriseus TaxID=66870 RepID=A0A918C095_9ACTN|nr:hypothetical protein GCM10010251_15660 [Streptomyces aurantiogriseus]
MAILLVLLLSAFLMGRFGVENLSWALTYTGRITGAILIVASITTVLGAAAVVDHWYWNGFPYSGLVALIGTVVALLANVLLLLQTFEGDSTAYRVLWGLLTAGCLWAGFALWRTSVVIPAPKRVAAAVVVSSALALANFGYQTLYKPYQHGAKPVIKMTVGEPMLSQDRKAFSVPVDIKLENQSDLGFYVLGAEFHAMGERVPLSARDRLRMQWRADAEQWSNSSFRETHPLSRREIHQPGQLVAAQPWMPTGHWIESNDEFVTRTVVQLPINAPYDQLAFYATASFARKDRLGLERVSPKGNSWSGGRVPQWMKAQKDVDSVIFRGRVRENNAIDELTRDPRFVTVYWMFGPHGADVIETITRKGEEDHVISDAESRELVNRYGIVEAQTGPFEQTLWDIKAQR